MLSLLALIRRSETNLDHYIGENLQFFSYQFETGAVSDIFATRKAKPPNVGGSIVLDVPSREVSWLKLAFSAIVTRCELELQRLNGEFDE